MENIIHNRFEKLLPYFRGFKYDDIKVIPRVSILLPLTWDVSYLVNNQLIIQSGAFNENSQVLMVGSNFEDITIDFLLDEIEKVINANLEQVKKKDLLKAKIKELESFVNNASLDEIQNLKILDKEMIVDDLLSENKIINEIISSENKSKLIIIDEEENNSIDIPVVLIDTEIKYNANPELPPMPGIIDEIDNYNKK